MQVKLILDFTMVFDGNFLHCMHMTYQGLITFNSNSSMELRLGKGKERKLLLEAKSSIVFEL